MVTADGSGGGHPRAVLLVANNAAPYSRGLRVARSLSAAGWDVEIAAVADGTAPDVEREGRILTTRYPPSGWARRLAEVLPDRARGGRIRRHAARATDLVVKGALWPFPVRAWWTTLRRRLPPADLYHAFGILTLPVALDLGRTARAQGRSGMVVYDVIDAILDSNNYASVPAPVLAWYRQRESRWVRRASAVVTVNEWLADHLVTRWPFRERPTVVMNCQPRWSPPDPRPNLIREATGLPQERKVVLFLGRLGPERGLDQAAEAVLRLPDAALVLLGFGHWTHQLQARDADSRYAGRHFTLPNVHPDEVRLWAASADVSVLAVPGNSVNQRLSTPNKLWESLVAGTPVVVGHELQAAGSIVDADGLGAIADASDVADLARALRHVLEQSPDRYEAMRARCVGVCQERFNWEVESRRLLDLYERLMAGASASPASGRRDDPTGG